MAPLRVVLYAEGGADLSGSVALLPASGHTLHEDHLGPAHVLTRRALCDARTVESADVEFVSPLRTVRGRAYRGSDYLDRRLLDRLDAWPQPKHQPDLTFVLIDRDGHSDRRTHLDAWRTDRPHVRAFGIAVEEFEAWLVGDWATAHRVLGIDESKPAEPESRAPREVRADLSRWITHANAAAANATVTTRRIELANACDLQVLKTACKSFERFCDALRRG